MILSPKLTCIFLYTLTISSVQGTISSPSTFDLAPHHSSKNYLPKKEPKVHSAPG